MVCDPTVPYGGKSRYLVCCYRDDGGLGCCRLFHFLATNIRQQPAAVDVRQVMPRYKGRSNSKAVERAFPHIVEIAVPPGGLGKRLDVMYDWHHTHGIEAHRGRGCREEGRDVIRWCFADAKTAVDFATAFGGSVVT